MPGVNESCSNNLFCELYEHINEMHRFIEKEIPPRFQSYISADDILQEVCVDAFRCDKSLIRNWNGWLKAATRSKLTDACRNARAIKRGGNMKKLAPVDFRVTSYIDLFDNVAGKERTPSTLLSAKEARNAVRLALAALPETRRQAVQMCHLEGMPRRSIAKKMNKSEAAVNSLIFAGMRQLRGLLGGAINGISSSDAS